MTDSHIDTSGHPRQSLLYGVTAGLVFVILTFVVNFGWWLVLFSAAHPNYFEWVATIVTSKDFVRYVGITLFWGVVFMLGYLAQIKTLTVIGAALCVYGGVFLAFSIAMTVLSSAMG